MRRSDVAQLANVSENDVQLVDDTIIRYQETEIIDPDVLRAMTMEPATYWFAGGKFYFDDPFFGDVVAVQDLAYDKTLGLHVKPS
jgi:hypothetical protein